MNESKPRTSSGGAGPEPASSAIALDPVCAMSLEPMVARARGLHSRHGDVDYSFCGRGCKLDFEEDPERYLGPDHIPSM